jgi:hypothetical protein
MSVLALSAMLAPGCGDDDDDNGRDAGPGEDAGEPDGGGGDLDASLDAGGDAGGGDAGAVECAASDAGTDGGVITCEGRDLDILQLSGCCVEDKGACGLDVTPIAQVSGGLFEGCVETNQPFVPAGHRISNTCTAIWEQLDDNLSDAGTGTPDGGPDGLTISVADMPVSFPGCCRLNDDGEGECGFLADEILTFDLGFGCLPLDDFRDAFPSEDVFNQVKETAKCDPATGEAVIPGGDGGTDAGGEDAGAEDAGAEDAGADAGDGG